MGIGGGCPGQTDPSSHPSLLSLTRLAGCGGTCQEAIARCVIPKWASASTQSPGRMGMGRGRSYLIWHHDERVFVFGQKVEETPELEGVLVGYNAIPVPVGLVVLLRCQGPAELVKIFFDKSTFLYLRAGARGVSEVLQGYRGGNGEG